MPRLGSERGAAAILVASALLALMGFAAFAVDIGAARNEQRLDQSAVDAAALAGGVEFILGGGASEAVDEIQQYTATNLGRPVSLSDWSSCTDAGSLELVASDASGVALPTDCISFGPGDDGTRFGRLRVALPTQETETSFGRVLGVDSVETSASAEVEISPTIDNDIFPAAIPETGGGAVRCLATGSDPSSSCDGLDALEWIMPVGCASPSLTDAMSNGFDELFGIDRGSGGRSGCVPFPNAISPVGSVDSSMLLDGLIVGRLGRKSWPGFDEATVQGTGIENRPLWTFIDTSGTPLPDVCSDAANGPTRVSDEHDAEFLQARDDMRSCLAVAPDGLFTSDLYESARLVLLPTTLESPPSRMAGFVPAFLDSVWLDYSEDDCPESFFEAPEDFCRHDPGRTGSSDQPVRSVSAALLSCGALSTEGVRGLDRCKTIGPDGTSVFLEVALSR